MSGNETPPGMGHNGPPEEVPYHVQLHMEAKAREDRKVKGILKAVGPKKPVFVKPFQSGAAWTRHLKRKEIERLFTLEGRIMRAEARVKELKAQRSTIMNRCIRRMRRLAGKN